LLLLGVVSVASEQPGTPEPRVLMLGKGWFPSALGGLDRYYRSLLLALPDAVGVVVGPADDAPPQITAVADPGVALPIRLLDFWRAAHRAAASCDIIDAHFALYAAAPLVVDRFRGRPVVFHFQGPWADESVSAGDASRIRFRLRRGIERMALRRATAFVVLSGAFRRVLVEGYGVPPWQVNVWSPGVPLDAFTPGDRAAARLRLGIDQAAFVVACTRRLVPRMGIEVLLDAWAELDGQLPPGSTAVIVGDGPLRESLGERIAAPALAGRVRLLGRLSDQELLDVYRAADVAAVPTVAFEGFGLVVLEAAACGTPSVVSDIGGLPEAVHRLDRTLIVRSRDVRAWADRLRRASTGELPTREETRAFAERFDWATLAARHRMLYRHVAAGACDARLRVVFLHHDGQLTADATALLGLLPHLHDVNAHVILGSDGPLVTRLHLAGISVEVSAFTSQRPPRTSAEADIDVQAGARSPLLRVAGIARLARRLRRLRPDVVHANTFTASLYGGIAIRAAPAPFVSHLRRFDCTTQFATRSQGLLVGSISDGVITNSDATLAAISRLLRRSRPVTALVGDIDVGTGHCGTDAHPLAAKAERQVMTVYRAVCTRDGRTARSASAAD
jgi:glycosyltransferase involved in cell wall biosynthesis